jgi:hypothetical protein
MQNETNCKTHANENCRHEWMMNHGTDFLRAVLWELGHPTEPTQTLIEVLNRVHEDLGSFIISLDDASDIIEEGRYIEHIDNQHRTRIRQERIEARNERQMKEPCQPKTKDTSPPESHTPPWENFSPPPLGDIKAWMDLLKSNAEDEGGEA